MFDAKNFNWNQKKLKGILDVYGTIFFKSKKVLDLGCGYSDISGMISRYGADVTVVDIQQDYLKIVKKRYPNIKTIRADLNENWIFEGKRFDFVLNLDLLPLINDYKTHLERICKITDNLILETVVFDSSQDRVFKAIESGNTIYIPTASDIEKLLISHGMHIQRLDDKKFNSSTYKYDWMPSQNNVYDINKRRLWFCKKSIKSTAIHTLSNVSVSKSTLRSNEIMPKVEGEIIEPETATLKYNDASNTKMPFLCSVIIPAFKANHFLDQCLNSIMTSIKGYNVEIIVGIDACQETLGWFEKKQFKNLNIYWFENNVGPYIIKNTLVDFAKSDNILFFDADDVMAPSMIENFIKNIKLSPLVKFKYSDFNNNTGINKPLPNTWYGEGVFGIKKDLFNRLNGFEGWICAADTEFQLRLRHNKISSKNVSEISFYRRLHSNNLTVNPKTRYGSSLRQNYIKIISDKTKNKKWILNKKTVANTSIINNKNISMSAVSNSILNQENNSQNIDQFEQDVAQNNPHTNVENTMIPNISFKVYHTIPWNSEKNIGKAYNEFMSLLNDEDWACFLDGDAVHTTSFFGKNIEQVIASNQDYGLFTCYTNRIGCSYQIPSGANWNNDSQNYHRDIGKKLWEKYKTNILDITNNSPLSGVLILINKDKWSQVEIGRAHV